MASLSELAGIVQSGGAAESFRQTTQQAQLFQEQQKELADEQALAKQSAQMPTQQGMSGLSQQSQIAVPKEWKLTDDQGMLTPAGQINSYLTQSIQERNQGNKLLKQAQFISDPKEKAALIAQGRLFINKATEFQTKASDMAKNTQNNAIYGLATAQNKNEWDNIVKGWENNGFPIPKGFPTEYSPENQKKVQQMAPAELQSKINTDLRNMEKEKEESKLRKLRINKLTADSRDGGTPGEVTTKVVDGKVIPLTPDEKLDTKNYGVAKGKVSTDDKKVARRVNTDAALITSSLDDVMTLNENGVKPLTGSTFSNLPDKGLITAPAKALANNLSDEDALTYDSAIGPAIREMVQFMMPDYRPTDAAFVKAEQIYKARSGEPYVVQLQKLAKLRQDYENIGMTYLDAGIMNATQAEQFKANLKKSRDMVPWTVKDVANFRVASEKRPNLTFKEFLAEKNIKPTPIPSSDKKEESKKPETVKVGDKEYTRPAGMSDQDWADYKKSVKAK